MAQELAEIPKQTALAIFTTADAIEPWLQHVRKEIDAFTPDISTAKGRKEIASVAHRVTRSKTYLDGVGKALADEVKAIPKKVDACRKHIRDTLDAWHDEVREPLDAWEEAEETRIAKHVEAISLTAAMAQHMDGRPAEELLACLAAVEGCKIGPHCEEFEAEYARTKDQTIAALRPAIAARQKYEAEQIELAKLRKEAEERAAKDREEAIRREAAEQATRAAEAAAKAASDKIAAAEAAEREKVAADARREREAGERRELELKLAAEAAARQALENENRLKEEAAAAQRLAADTEARIKREAKEAADREAAATAAREADKLHKGKVNRAAVQALVAGGIAEETARSVITLIAKKAVPAVSISY